jgi:hypothetical protein
MSPAAEYPPVFADLVRDRLDVASEAVTSTVDELDVAVLVVALGSTDVPLAVAVLVTEPKSTSDWSTV